jgi:ABC-type amino acid transport system permease subunit
MMSKADLMGAYSYHHLELYLDVGLIYIALCAIVQIGVIIVNRSFRYA